MTSPFTRLETQQTIALLDTITFRRRKHYTSSLPSSQPANTTHCTKAGNPKGGKNNVFKHRQSTFFLCRHKACKSVLMIGAVLMILTLPLAQKNRHLSYLRHQSQSLNDSSGIQTRLTEVMLAARSVDEKEVVNTMNGEADAADIAGPEKVIDEPVVEELEVVDEEEVFVHNIAEAEKLIAEAPASEPDVVVQEEAVAYNPKQYTTEMAAKAVEPTVWTCGDKDRTSLDPVTNQRPFFAFVHVYKTAGSTMRWFFEEYADICKKSFALVISCHGLDLESCRLKKSVNAPRSIESVNSAVLHDHYDILGGHYSFGMADGIFPNSADTSASQVRHLVFLRQPMTRFVSHVLYKKLCKDCTVEDTADYIKNRIRSSRNNGEYESSVYKYLLTPEQRAMKYEEGQTQEEVVAHKARLSIDNLVRYNAIIGMTERFPQSITIIEQAMGRIASTSEKKEKEAQDLFSWYYEGKESANVSDKNGITTKSVLKELNKDEEFMEIFQEFVKYEQMIVDFAMEMHQLQYEAVDKRALER